MQPESNSRVIEVDSLNGRNATNAHTISNWSYSKYIEEQEEQERVNESLRIEVITIDDDN